MNKIIKFYKWQLTTRNYVLVAATLILSITASYIVYLLREPIETMLYIFVIILACFSAIKLSLYIYENKQKYDLEQKHQNDLIEILRLALYSSKLDTFRHAIGAPQPNDISRIDLRRPFQSDYHFFHYTFSIKQQQIPPLDTVNIALNRELKSIDFSSIYNLKDAHFESRQIDRSPYAANLYTANIIYIEDKSVVQNPPVSNSTTITDDSLNSFEKSVAMGGWFDLDFNDEDDENNDK